jgi:hypothetical protein
MWVVPLYAFRNVPWHMCISLGHTERVQANKFESKGVCTNMPEGDFLPVHSLLEQFLCI